MPTYAFTCERCGPFDELRPMAEATAPARCPGCDTGARRLFTAPGVARMPAAMSRALTMEAKSAHEPAVVSAPRGRPMHVHGAGCGHGH